jgi:outer membrane lipoprotein-sorting protein
MKVCLCAIAIMFFLSGCATQNITQQTPFAIGVYR